MAITVTIDVSALVDQQTADASDVTTPFADIKGILEDVLNGAQSAESVRFDELAGEPSTPATGKWKLYAKSTGLYIIDDGATVIGPLGTGGAGTSDHGALTGLADDDHTQYLLVSGSRAMTGALAMGNQDINNAKVIRVYETSAPGTPSSGYGAIYAKSSDNLLYYKTDGGVEYNLTSGGGSVDYIHIEEQQTSGTQGGTFTASAWQTRTLNTEVTDTGSHASVASNQITLAAGTYEADIVAPAYKVNFHQARLQNITDGTTTLTGTNGTAAASNTGFSHSTIKGRFTIAGTKVFEVQHYCTTTAATNGFGASVGAGTEVYTVATFRKVG